MGKRYLSRGLKLNSPFFRYHAFWYGKIKILFHSGSRYQTNPEYYINCRRRNLNIFTAYSHLHFWPRPSSRLCQSHLIHASRHKAILVRYFYGILVRAHFRFTYIRLDAALARTVEPLRVSFSISSLCSGHPCARGIRPSMLVFFGV